MPLISEIKAVQDFFSLFLKHGLKNVVICPGSRNAPFSISLPHLPQINSFVIPDERSAAYFALGMAQQSEQTVGLICTSGTASLNFAPALAEAYYQRIPLLVVTADRPIEWIDQGEGQSIRQENVFRNYIKASYTIEEDAVHPDLIWHNNRIMDEAFRLTTQGVPGPVHINFPLREPLYKTCDVQLPDVKSVKRIHAARGLDHQNQKLLTDEVENCKKVLILAGQNPPNERLRNALLHWTKNDNVVVFTEAHSNLADPNWVTTIDRTITKLDERQLSDLQPDLVITFGHNIISRKVKDWLRKSPKKHWHIDISGEGLDTLKQLCLVIPMDPADFFASVVPNCAVSSSYGSSIEHVHADRKAKSKTFLDSARWSDLLAFSIIYPHIPSGYHLQMGNSSVVRYILLLDARGDIQHAGNRGVAGIDGATSTAIGASMQTKLPTVLITGDIAFFYDINAYWNNYVPNNFKTIVINNQGGGIFRIIDGPQSSPALDHYFETTHQRSAKKVAEMYDLTYFNADSEKTLCAVLDQFWQCETKALLEIHTPRTENDVVLKEYFNFIANSK